MQPTTKKEQVKDAAQNVTDKAKDVAHTVADEARDTAHQVADAARDVASPGRAGPSAAPPATSAGRPTSGRPRAGHRVEALADTVRSQGPNSGTLGKATGAVADTLEGVGGYMADKDLSGMMDDVTNLIKQQPDPRCWSAWASASSSGVPCGANHHERGPNSDRRAEYHGTPRRRHQRCGPGSSRKSVLPRRNSSPT